MTYWFAASLRIAALESRRKFREMRELPRVTVLVLATLAILVPGIVGRLPVPVYESVWTNPGAYVYGTRLAAGEHAPVMTAARKAAVGVFGMAVYLVGLPSLKGNGPIGDREGLLLSVSVRVIAVAEMFTYAVSIGRFGGVVILAGSVAFGVGTGSILAVVTLVSSAAVAFFTAIGLTYPLTLGLKLAFRRSEWLAEHKVLVAGPLVVGAFLVVTSGPIPATVGGWLPLTWYADLGLLGTTSEASPVRAALAVGGMVASLAVGVPAASRLGEAYWLADDTRPADDSSSTNTADDSTPSFADRVVGRVASQPVAAVVRVTWRRLQYEPRAFLFGGLLIAFTISAALTAVERDPTLLPFVVMSYGAATFGVGVTMNPLGNEGPTLPATLTTPAGGRHVVAGYALAASLPGGVVVGVVTVLAGLSTSLPVAVVVGLGMLGVVLGVAGPAVSLALGIFFPKFSGIDPTDSTGLHPPHIQSAMLYLLVMSLVTIPAFVGVYRPELLAGRVGVDPFVVTAAGAGTTVLVAVGLARLSFDYAATTLRTYELDG